MSLTHGLSEQSLPVALPRVRGGWRSARLPAVLFGTLFFIALTSFVGQLLAARTHLIVGASYLDGATAVARNPLTLRDPVQREALEIRLMLARNEFAAARGDLWLWSPLLPHLTWIPHWGVQIGAADAAAGATFNASDAALSTLKGLGPVLTSFQTSSKGQSRLQRVSSALKASEPSFRAAGLSLSRAQRDASRLPASFEDRHLDALAQELRHQLPLMRSAANWLALAPTLLGADHPETYLFLWQNPAELRATGGFLGASDFMTIDHGRISHQFYGHDLPHQITWPPMPLPEEMYTPESNWLFEDSNWSPDFPLSARFERWFYGEDTGRWADGVVNFLDTATPDLLQAVGPVFLPSYHLWVSAKTVTPLAERYINGHYSGPSNAGYRDAVRKQFFFAVLRALLTRAETLPLERLPALASVLQKMLAERSLLVYHRNARVEAAIRGAHAAGRLLPGHGDYLFVVDDNRSYNKLNPYVRESAAYDVTIEPSLRLDATLTLHYHVNPSPADLEGGGPNWGLWGDKHDYQDFVRVFVPRGATLKSMSGLDPWKPQPAYGATQLAGRLLLQEDESRTVTFRYSIPANVFAAGGPRIYRLRIQHQPGADLRSLHVTVHAGHGVGFSDEAASKESTVSLVKDAAVTVRLDSALHPRFQRLAPLPAEPDPYIPFKYLVDPKHPL